MKAAVTELTNSRNERQRAKEILLMKHKKIEDFEKLAVRIICTCYEFINLVATYRREPNPWSTFLSKFKYRFFSNGNFSLGEWIMELNRIISIVIIINFTFYTLRNEVIH